MMTAPGRYIFCDIDGTLLYAKGAGRPAFHDAILDAYNVSVDISHINFSGATDLGVLKRLLQENKVEPDERKTAHFFERLPFYLNRNLTDVPPTVFPGVLPFLKRISLHWNLALVSGNCRECAFLKLKHGGLDAYFTSIGGFGDDDGDRNRMAAIALERAGNPASAFLMGDTPSDIEAAKVNGMVSVAVCNGQFTRDMLRSENPDILVNSFEEAEHLFEALDV